MPAYRTVPGHQPQRNVAVAQNNTQYIIEIVRHAPSQTPNGFHLLGLPKLGFQLLHLCDIPSDSQQAGLSAQFDRFHPSFCFSNFSFRGPVSRMAPHHVFLLVEFLQYFLAILRFGPEVQFRGSVTNHLSPLVTQQLEQSFIRIQIAPFGSGRDRDRQRVVAKRLAESFFRSK